MERVRKYRSENGAEYELVQTKPPTKKESKGKQGSSKTGKDAKRAKKETAAEKRKAGLTYDKEIGGWIDPNVKNPEIKKMLEKGWEKARRQSRGKKSPSESAKRKKRSSSGKTVRRKVSLASRMKKARKGAAKRGNKRKGGQLLLIV